MRALSVAATGMMAQQLHVEVIANNIANLSTTGFKRQRPEFQDLLYQSMRRIGSATSADGTILPAGVELGLGVKTAAVYRIHDQGNLVNTENSLDLAIQGEGYFVVQLPDGTVGYTRAGNFRLSADGMIVTAEGYTVNPGISVPSDAIEITINSEGGVFAKIQGQTSLEDLGQLELARFVNPAGLEALGGNLLAETDASGPATIGTPGSDGFGVVQQGFLESSNVNAVQELTALIAAQRAYELNSKIISAADNMLGTVTQLR